MHQKFEKVLVEKYGEGQKKEEDDKLTKILDALNQNLHVISKSL